MQEIVIDNGYLVMKAYAAEDYKVNSEQINKECLNIIESYEKDDDDFDYEEEDYSQEEDFDEEQQLAMDSFEKITEDFFDDERDGMIYILYNVHGEPVSYAIWSQKDRTDSWLLEFIQTNKRWRGCGFGGTLLEQSATNLAMFKDAKEIMSVIVNQNASSRAMHETFYKKHNLKCSVIIDAGRREYCVPTANLLKDFQKEQDKGKE